jgi:hypothetical protein
MGYQDWDRVARELAEMFPRFECAGNSHFEGLRCPDHMSPSLEPSSSLASDKAEVLLEHIAQALDKTVIPRHD